MGGREKLGAGADLGGVSPVVWLLPVGASPPKTRGRERGQRRRLLAPVRPRGTIRNINKPRYKEIL